ncbi:MAG: aspartate carbamoyltransferase catalytic subunit [Eubacteriales bacterium]|nr:aspartate carbamoyltransferase catalytic subunit [Eubacteriales bacterium]
MFEDMKDLLGIKDLQKSHIEKILDTAKTMKHIISQNNKKTGHLIGKSIVTLFYENSTRTRLSFELAAKYMSGFASNISVNASSVSKGESLIDTAKTIDAMGTDVVILRHSRSGTPHLIAKNINASVINAGDGMNEHPTQALLDMFTMREKKGRIEGLKVAIVGDVLHSRVARSNIWGLTKLGAEVSIGAPSTLLPADLQKTGVKVYNSIHEAVVDADVVMGLRIQQERQKRGLFPSVIEYARFFGIDERRLSLAKPDALLLHPGPVNRGVELSSSVLESEKSFVNEQVTNGVAIRMAILYLYTRKGNEI